MKKKIYQLSKNGIKYLYNFKINDTSSIFIKSLIIKTHLIFQIINAEKIKLGVYSATLVDTNFKSDRFMLFFNKKNEIPKKGDIIEIQQVEKRYNKKYKYYLYKCRKIIFIKKESNFIVDISKIENYDNIYDINNKKNKNVEIKEQKVNIINNKIGLGAIDVDLNEEEEEEEDEEDIDEVKYEDYEEEKNNNEDKKEKKEKKEKYKNKIIINKIYEEEKINVNNSDNNNNNNININNYNKINKDENNMNENGIYAFNNVNKYTNSHKFLLVSNIDFNSTNFNMYLKCLVKFGIKEFKTDENRHYQNYIFEDINNDKIEAISFDEMSYKLDNIIKINEFYQINNCYLISTKKEYKKINSPYKILFAKTVEIFNVSNMEIIINTFKNNYNANLNNKNFTRISEIININKFDTINVYGFVLKDYGNFSYIEKNINKKEKHGRNILIGDDSGYKIIITFWHHNNLKNIYNEGELLYIQNAKVVEYKKLKHLYSTKYITIQNSFNLLLDTKLKKYYSVHKDINEYSELKKDNNKITNNSAQKYYKVLLIKEIFTIFNNKGNKEEKINRFKISAYVRNINHTLKNYYYGCDNCRKKMINNICNNCGGKNKIIIIHFTVKVMDSTSILYILFFGNIAEDFLGINAEEYKKILEKGISYQNKELNLINSKLEKNEFIFLGNIQYYDNSKYKGYRFLVKYFSKKTRKDYHSLVNYLKQILK